MRILGLVLMLAGAGCAAFNLCFRYYAPFVGYRGLLIWGIVGIVGLLMFVTHPRKKEDEDESKQAQLLHLSYLLEV